MPEHDLEQVAACAVLHDQRRVLGVVEDVSQLNHVGMAQVSMQMDLTQVRSEAVEEAHRARGHLLLAHPLHRIRRGPSRRAAAPYGAETPLGHGLRAQEGVRVLEGEARRRMGVLRRVRRVLCQRRLIRPLGSLLIQGLPRQLRQLARFQRVEGSVGDHPDCVGVQRYPAAHWYSHLTVLPVLPDEALPERSAVAHVLVPNGDVRGLHLGQLEAHLAGAPLRVVRRVRLQADGPLGSPAAELRVIADDDDRLAPAGREVPQAEDHLDARLHLGHLDLRLYLGHLHLGLHLGPDVTCRIRLLHLVLDRCHGRDRRPAAWLA
mmetsp:Transcript_88746/g.192205  ORF Transcript_88746/g.192205 Transcript_88746/m.192205 type:complete len:320 (+) Transcript_88746:510-1469(+)